MLKLPDRITTCLFDLDGVLTQTATIHARAWKEMFDGFLRDWAERNGEPFEEFDRPTDCDEYVDGNHAHALDAVEEVGLQGNGHQVLHLRVRHAGRATPAPLRLRASA